VAILHGEGGSSRWVEWFLLTIVTGMKSKDSAAPYKKLILTGRRKPPHNPSRAAIRGYRSSFVFRFTAALVP
jgi:hypothetical protein